MSFNPAPSKQAVGIFFSRKIKVVNTPIITFNNINITDSESHKHLGLILDSKLSFDHHLREKINKANKGIGLINKFRIILHRNSLLNIYKTFVRPHLDYADIIYDYPGNVTFSQKLETIQYNACLAITGCFRGTSREKLYSELGLESLADRRFSRKLFYFYKIINGMAPNYLSKLLPARNLTRLNLRSRFQIYPLETRTERFRNSFFPFCIREWNNLDSSIRNLPTISSFKRAIFEFFRPKSTPTFNLPDYSGLTLLTRLRVGFSHLREHKFRHGFQDTIDPFCSCRSNAIENTEHYLLQCSNFANERLILFDKLQTLDVFIIPFTLSHLTRLCLYGEQKFDDETNREILVAVIKFLRDSNRFSGPLL